MRNLELRGAEQLPLFIIGLWRVASLVFVIVTLTSLGGCEWLHQGTDREKLAAFETLKARVHVGMTVDAAKEAVAASKARVLIGGVTRRITGIVSGYQDPTDSTFSLKAVFDETAWRGWFVEVSSIDITVRDSIVTDVRAEQIAVGP